MSARGTDNSERRVGGIVTAVTLAIAAAFAVVMLLFLNQSVHAAADYVEGKADSLATLASSELSAALGGHGASRPADAADADTVRTLAAVLDECCEGTDEDAACFAQDGTVLFASEGGARAESNVFEAYPQLRGLSSELRPDASGRWAVWEGLDNLLARDREFYEVRYSGDIGCYLLVTSTGASTFADMRERFTGLILTLAVVMVLLLLLVITSVRWYRARLMKVATTDELTGLANRRSFVSKYARLARKAGGAPASLMLVDVDYFKRINDTYGHAAGDRALAAIADEVRKAAGPGGIAGRWGGDEFIGVLDAAGAPAREAAQGVVDRVKALDLGDGADLSVSIGMTELDWSQSLERMVEQADIALYLTKEGGRGFLTVYDPDLAPQEGNPEQHGQPGQAARREHEAAAIFSGRSRKEPAQTAPADNAHASEGPRRHGIWNLVVKSLLDAVAKMIPFVAGGGILIAIAFLIEAANVDVNALSPEMRSEFGSITPLAAGLRQLGAAAFNFMLPIFAAFFARGLAGNHAFMAGFAGGYLASQGTSGFAGAIFAALVSAIVVRLMKNFLDETVPLVQRIAPVLLYPVFSLLIMYLSMVFLIDPLASAFDSLLTSLLTALEPGNRIVLGTICGAMMATDMGGPINKAAYHFGTAAIAAGSPDIMAAVMVGGMVPPCGIAICLLMFPDRFADGRGDLAPSTFIMGLSFITEGALPFVLTDFARVIPSCMLGAALAGALSMAYGCTLMAPHGGIFVFPVVGNPGLYLVALMAGSLLTALTLGLLKQVHLKRRP